MWVELKNKQLINLDRITNLYIHITVEFSPSYVLVAKTESSKSEKEFVIFKSSDRKNTEEILKRISIAISSNKNVFIVPDESEL